MLLFVISTLFYRTLIDRTEKKVEQSENREKIKYSRRQGKVKNEAYQLNIAVEEKLSYVEGL